MRRVRLGGQGISMWTPPMQRADTVPPKRTKISGWTKGAARRNRAFLMSIDPLALSHDLGYAVTLTLGATPISAAIWASMIHRFLTTLRRCGMIRYHWVTEWTKKGRPHLHLTFFLKGRAPIPPVPEKFSVDLPVAPPLELMKTRAAGAWSFYRPLLRQGTPYKIIGPNLHQKPTFALTPVSDWFTDWVITDAVHMAWERACHPLPCHRFAQHVERITAVSGWHAYVAKHCARGVEHYQRIAAGLPDGWTSSGRLWGKGGDWPICSDTLELDDTSFFRLRRAVRRWLRAKAAFKTKRGSGIYKELAQKELRYLRRSTPKPTSDTEEKRDPRKLSSVYGLTSFIPRDLLDMLLIWAMDHPDAVLIDVETSEVFGRGAAADRAIIDQIDTQPH